MTRSFKPTRERKQRRKPKHHGLETEGNKALDVAPITTTSTITINTLVKDATGGENPNAEIIIPRTKAEKDELKRAQLQAEFRAGAPKMSSRKKKRLDKYIVGGMRKSHLLTSSVGLTRRCNWVLVGEENAQARSN